MKNSAIAVTIITISAIILYALAPDQRIYSLTKHAYRLVNNPSQLCFDLHANTLKDSNSAYITGRNDFKDTAIVTYKARNGLNMYMSGTFECPLVDGRFDDHKAFMQKIDG